MSNIYTFQFLKDLEIKRKAIIMIEGLENLSIEELKIN